MLNFNSGMNMAVNYMQIREDRFHIIFEICYIRRMFRKVDHST